jgi:hypothetical protein
MKSIQLMAVLGMSAGSSLSALGAEHPASRDAVFVPIPLSTGWVEGFLLMIVWLFVAAVIIGPLVTYFRLERRSPQVFIDDRKSNTP